VSKTKVTNQPCRWQSMAFKNKLCNICPYDKQDKKKILDDNMNSLYQLTTWSKVKKKSVKKSLMRDHIKYYIFLVRYILYLHLSLAFWVTKTNANLQSANPDKKKKTSSAHALLPSFQPLSRHALI